MKIKFNTEGKPEKYKVCIIKYRHRTEDKLPYEVGSAYYNGGWWVNFYDPHTFSREYQVLGWSYYDFKEVEDEFR